MRMTTARRLPSRRNGTNENNRNHHHHPHTHHARSSWLVASLYLAVPLSILAVRFFLMQLFTGNIVTFRTSSTTTTTTTSTSGSSGSSIMDMPPLRRTTTTKNDTTTSAGLPVVVDNDEKKPSTTPTPPEGGRVSSVGAAVSAGAAQARPNIANNNNKPGGVSSARVATIARRNVPARVKRKIVKTYPPQAFKDLKLLRSDDPIYKKPGWDVAPIVVPSHKLLFFTIPKVGCTVFKQLFRRMMNHTDWKSHNDILPHDPDRNGLTYLYDVPPSVADAMLTDPAWTRAIFVRDPKERILSAYLDKVVYEKGAYVKKFCCKGAQMKLQNEQKRQQQQKQKDLSDLGKKARRLYELLHCAQPPKPAAAAQKQGNTIVTGAVQKRALLLRQQQELAAAAAAAANKNQSLMNFTDFVTTLYPICPDPHWAPQVQRLSEKYWSSINFVGHFDTMERDARIMLERVGAWEDYGATGWWPHESLFHSSSSNKHSTSAKTKLQLHYTSAALERQVEEIFRKDYEHAMMNFSVQTKIVNR